MADSGAVFAQSRLVGLIPLLVLSAWLFGFGVPDLLSHS